MDFEEVLKVLDAAVFAKSQRHLKDVERYVLWGACLGQTYDEMAKVCDYRYTPRYLKQHVGPRLWKLLSEALGEDLSKTNFRSALERRAQLGEALQIQQALDLYKAEYEGATANRRQDWGEAIDVSVFYGRAAELATLKQWIVEDRCRLVVLLGIGGIGKTALSVKLAEQIQGEFEYLIWRSLRNAPPIQELLAELILFLSNQQEITLPATVDGRVSRLIAYLRQHRCLLVLDSVDSIMRGSEPKEASPSALAGHYREGYEGYGQLLRCVGETRHQSALVLTSREKPRGFASKSGLTLPVRALKLTGLKQAEGQEIFRAKGAFSGSESEWRVLIEHYAGNPLALKIVAEAIEDLFEHNVSKFIDLLRKGPLVFGEIRAVLDQQFNRLSGLEKQIMYWLAINREKVSFLELSEEIVSQISQSKLMEALESLEQRSLLEKKSTSFTQQPVVMEYVTERLIEQVYEEITTEKLSLLMSHVLLKAQAKDYIRASQTRAILEPVADRLRTTFRTKKDIEHKLNQILLKLRN